MLTRVPLHRPPMGEGSSAGKKPRILAALSGGVDSSTAAALLLRQGYEVVGVSMKLWSSPEPRDNLSQGCCSPEDIRDARRVADILDIPFVSKDLTRVFQAEVVDYFTREYLSGKTPNPCILCNQKLKFDVLFETARELGAEYIATGHYAAIEEQGGHLLIRRGKDPVKDQSYYLFGILPESLENMVFPLGDLCKTEVRRLASSFGLPTADKEESQEICFISNQSYADFIRTREPSFETVPGSFVLESGEVVGEHKGIVNYTVGQRRGLGIGFGERMYVTEIDTERNLVRLGPKEELFRSRLWVENTRWMVPPGHPFRENLTVQIRSRHRAAPAEVETLEENRALVRFQTPQMSIAPGQAAVFYHGEFLVGGGWISKSVPAQSAGPGKKG